MPWRYFEDEGRGGDPAGDLELLEAPDDAEAAGTGLVSDFQVRARMSLVDAAEGFLHSPQVVGDGAKEADLALGPGLGDGEGDGVFVDI